MASTASLPPSQSNYMTSLVAQQHQQVHHPLPMLHRYKTKVSIHVSVYPLTKRADYFRCQNCFSALTLSHTILKHCLLLFYLQLDFWIDPNKTRLPHQLFLDGTWESSQYTRRPRGILCTAVLSCSFRFVNPTF